MPSEGVAIKPGAATLAGGTLRVVQAAAVPCEVRNGDVLPGGICSSKEPQCWCVPKAASHTSPPLLLARLLFGGGGCCAGVRWVQAAPASCPKSAGACSNGQHISQRRAAAIPAWDGKHKRAAVTQRGASVSSSRAGESQPSAVSWELEEEEEGRSRTPASTQMLC